jgi:DNA-binding NarL/FixJ family response regulator
VIGDDPFILEPLKTLLDLLGLETILRAADDEQAPTFQAGAAVDLLITDVLMSNLDGPSLLTRIRSGRPSAAASLPCILVSSLGDAAILETALALDVNGFG